MTSNNKPSYSERMARLRQIPESQLAQLEEQFPEAVHAVRWNKICQSDLPMPEKKAALLALKRRQVQTEPEAEPKSDG